MVEEGTMESAPPDTSLTRRRVLVVEDEYFLADDMARALRSLGAEVVDPVATCDGAIAALGAGPVDAAILDINLRGQTAFPVADLLIARSVPFVFATGYDRAAVPAAYLNVPRWQKPFDTDSLLRALPRIVVGS